MVSFYKKRTILCSLFITLASLSAQAQDAIPVMDIQLQNELESQAEDHMRQSGNLMLIRRSNRRAGDVVEDTRSLQEQYRHFLRQTTSTANLAWMNSQAAQEQLEWVAAASGHLDDYDFSKQLAEIHSANIEPGQKSQLLYDWLIPFDETVMLTSVKALRQDQQQRLLHYEALRQMQQRRQLQLARLGQKSTISSQQKSQQLAGQLLRRNRVSTPGVATPGFSMTEAERLSMLGKINAGFLSSQKSQLKADEFIHQSSEYVFSKALLLNSFHQLHLRESMGSTNLYAR